MSTVRGSARSSLTAALALLVGCVAAPATSPAPEAPARPVRTPDAPSVELEPLRIGDVPFRPDAAPQPADLPRFAVRGVIEGRAFEPRTVVLKRLSGHGAWFLAFVRDAQPDPCAMRWFRLPGFELRLRASRPTAGESLHRLSSGTALESVQGEPDLSGLAEIHPDELTSPTYRSFSAAAASVVLDAIDETHVEGRVYVAGTAEHPSLLTGAFRGIVCPDE